MAVLVRFVDGTEREFPSATSAHCDGPVFRVTKWNPRRRKLEDVEVFDSSTVTLAELPDGGVELGVPGHSQTDPLPSAASAEVVP